VQCQCKLSEQEKGSSFSNLASSWRRLREYNTDYVTVAPIARKTLQCSKRGRKRKVRDQASPSAVQGEQDRHDKKVSLSQNWLGVPLTPQSRRQSNLFADASVTPNTTTSETTNVTSPVTNDVATPSEIHEDEMLDDICAEDTMVWGDLPVCAPSLISI
jgi:hypothetical protein